MRTEPEPACEQILSFQLQPNSSYRGGQGDGEGGRVCVYVCVGGVVRARQVGAEEWLKQIYQKQLTQIL